MTISMLSFVHDASNSGSLENIDKCFLKWIMHKWHVYTAPNVELQSTYNSR